MAKGDNFQNILGIYGELTENFWGIDEKRLMQAMQMVTQKEKELFLAEKLKNLNEEITALMPMRADILHHANEALNSMVVLKEAIEKPYK